MTVNRGGRRDVRGPGLRADRRLRRGRAPADAHPGLVAEQHRGRAGSAASTTPPTRWPCPLLSSLTDRVDPKRIYLGSVALTAAGLRRDSRGSRRASGRRWRSARLMGVGWAGSYMPGLKALSDCAEGPQQSRRRGRARGGRRRQRRALVRRRRRGQRLARLAMGARCRARSGPPWRFALVLVGLPARAPRVLPREPRGALLDFRPILRNRSALAYSIAYGVHTWEMSALQGMGRHVPDIRRRAGVPARGRRSAPATVASVMGLLGVWASVWGNELAIRFGRRRFILGTMLASAALAGGDRLQRCAPVRRRGGARAGLRDADLVGLLVAHRGQRRAAPSPAAGARPWPSTRRSGMPAASSGRWRSARRSISSEAPASIGWGLAFGHVALAVVAGWVAFVWLRPADLAGDRAVVRAPGIARSAPPA